MTAVAPQPRAVDSPPSQWRWLYRAPYLTFPLVLVGVVVTAWVPGTRAPLTAGSVLLLNIIALALSVGVAGRAAIDPATRRAWRMLSVAVVLLGVSGIGYGIALRGGISFGTSLTVGMVGRLLAVPVLLVGLAALPMRPASRRDLQRLGLDLTVLTGVGAMLLWYFVISPALVHDVAADTLAMAAFPICDILMIISIGAVLLRGATSARRPLILLLGAQVAFLLINLVIGRAAVTSADRELPASTLLDLVLVFAAFLVAAAAAEQYHAAPLNDPESDVAEWRSRPLLSLPYLAIGVGSTVSVVAAFHAGPHPWGGLVAAATVVTAAFAARHGLAAHENSRLVRTDSLTGLANRRRLRDNLDRAVARSRRTGEPVAVLLIDLDGFKEVNDEHGHEAGDAVLLHFARLLDRQVRAKDTAARLGGDEFAVVVLGVDSAGAGALARRILDAANEPISIGGRRFRTRASIGIAVADTPGIEPRELLYRADVAMHRTKRRQSHDWQLFAEEHLPEDEQPEVELRRAIQKGQLRVLYQPIVDLVTGDLAAVEALVRWDHPTRGVLGPQAFLPAAEESGLINDLGRFVLAEACTQMRGWRGMLPDGRSLHLSVNFSPSQFARPDFAEDVLGIVDRTGFDPADLVVEITEGALVDEELVVPQLEILRARGVRIALDDFGTGYSTLYQITRLPIDVLKLDRSFVMEINGGRSSNAVAEAVVRIARMLHLDTVAEGIEEPSQAAELTVLGFKNGQGFYFAEPMTPDAVRTLISAPHLQKA
jgi:diguanylate cyclase